MGEQPGQSGRLFGAMMVMVAVVVIGAAIAMVTADEAPPGLYLDGGAGRYGYTISLALFVVPVLSLIVWFGRHKPSMERHWRAFWITFGIIVVLWSVLDILLARTFFTFPFEAATLGVNVIGYDPATGWGAVVPVEEFVFYILGCAFLVLTYIWASEFWFPEYTMGEEVYQEAAERQRLGALFDWRVVAAGVGVVLLAVLVKWWDPVGTAEGGFPGYLTFIVLLVAVPTMMFFEVVLRFVNVRAMVFTLQSMLLIALLWEATLALPYGWWNYQHNQMVGIFITPWSNLPIEAALLWFAATWSNIAIYEVAKLWVHHRHRDLPSGHIAA
jgi:hypothetical protein